MLILGSCIRRFLPFYSIFFKSKLQLAWIHFTFCVVALWEESIWSPLCPTIPFSVASWHTFFFFIYIFSPMIPLHCSPVRPQSPCLPNQPGPSPFCWLLWLLPHHEGVKVSPAHCTTIPAPSFHFRFLTQTLFLVLLITVFAFFYFQ